MHIDVALGTSTWSYTLFNDEQATSPNYISYFTLDVAAPILVTGVPTGWDYQTDNSSYVFWFNTDPTLPYPHDIAPGASIGGFQLESTASASASLGYVIQSWNHSADQPGLGTSGTTLAPSAAVPEPNSLLLLLSAGASFTVSYKRGHSK